MHRRHFLKQTVFSLAAVASMPTTGASAMPRVADHRRLNGEGLAVDAAVLADAFRSLHPGIYRYTTLSEFERRCGDLAVLLGRGATRAQAFLAVTRFTAAIRCGHTWTNPLNQPPEVAAELLRGRDRLPLHFTVVGQRLLVTSATGDSIVRPHDEIVGIDGRSVREVFARLWPYLRADCASDGKRLAQIGHDAGQSAFDLYYALLEPPRGTERRLDIRAPGGQRVRRLRVSLVTEEARDAELRQPSGTAAEPWSYRIDPEQAVITMPTWAFWNTQFDWQSWLDRRFESLRAGGTKRLIIDLRRNEGGDGAIGEALLRRLTTEERAFETHYPRLVYDLVPDRLRPHLSTWDRSFYDQRSRIEPLGDGAYTLLDRDPPRVQIKPSDRPFSGRTVVLTGPTMSSATFEFARIVKETGIATLVGQPTGGNLRGINGGNLFFLKLPHSGISVDVPVISYMPRTPQPDAPVLPDLVIPADFEALTRGDDPELRAVTES